MPHEVVADRYRLQERVGSGAMGVVWRARDERLGRTVALKQVTPAGGADEEARTRSGRQVMREGRLSARLHHPQAIAVFDVVEHEGSPWLVMEYLASRDLAAVLAEGALEPAEAARIGEQIAAALQAAHAAGIVHRDVKPGNVLVADDGRVKVTDFGISRAVDEVTLTSTGMVAGTPAYLAPEVARGARADFRSDVWSLGATLYAAVEGAPPFGRDENALAQLHRVASGEIDPPRRAGALTPLLLRTLQDDPERRPPVGEVRDELARLHAGTAPTDAVPEPLTPALPRPALAGPPSGPSGPAAAPVGTGPAAAGSMAAGPMAAGPVAAGSGSGAAASVAAGSGAAGSGAAGSGAAGSGAAAPVAAGPGAAGTTVSTPAPRTAPVGSPAPRRGRLAAGIGAAVLLVGVVLAVVLATSSGTDPAATPAAPSSGAASPTTSATDGSTAPPATGPSAAPPVVPESDGDAQVAAVRSYYGLLPGRLDQGFAQLTPSYQQGTAGGFANYSRFWGALSAVTVRGVSSPSPGSVDATVTYSYPGGRVVDERTLFTMVRRDGTWKIDGSRVLSSQGR